MKNIITLTLNPALDKTVVTKELVPDKKLRCPNPTIQPGGGGVNVSRALNQLDVPSKALYLAGGYTGSHYTHLLQKEGVQTQVIETEAHTRENIIVFDESTQQQYRLGIEGESIAENEWQQVLQMLEKETFDILIASGSLPPGIPTNFYKELAALVNRKNAKLVIDTSGAALKDAVDEGVFLIKPNLHELSTLYGVAELPKDEVVKACRDIIAKGYCQVIAVSMGADGALLVTHNEEHTAKPPAVEKKSTVGAGDSMVAGMVAALYKGCSWKDVLRYGVACGTAATLNAGTELCKKEDVERLLQQII